MKTYEEMAEQALDRIHEYEAEQKKRRKTAARIITPAVSFCAVAALGIGVWQMGLFQTEAPITEPDNTEAVSTTEAADVQIITGEDDMQKDTDSSNKWVYFWWNRLSISGPLKFAIEENPNGVFAVVATYHPTSAEAFSFAYEGRTLQEWAEEAYEENASTEAKEAYKRAYNACLETVLPAAVEKLTASGIRCERTAYRNNGVTLIVTAEELKNLLLENTADWDFDLSSNDLKCNSQTETIATELQTWN